MTASTTQDGTSDAHPDDAELQRRLEAHYTQRLARRVGPLLIWAAVVLAVLGLWWACGVPDLLHGWFTDWWTMSSSSSRNRLDQAALEVLMDPNWTPPPPTTIWQDMWADRAILALGLGILVFILMCCSWFLVRISTRWNDQLLKGVRIFGLHACPHCGGDTRSDAGTGCRFCRDITSERVPTYWREFILDESRFSKAGFQIDEQIFQSQRFSRSTPSQTNKRRGLIWIGATIVLVALCVVTIHLLSLRTPIAFLLGYVPLTLGIIGLTRGLRKIFDHTQVSEHGFCPKCEYELLTETMSDQCPECGKACPEGRRIYSIEHSPFWISCVPISLWLVYSLFLCFLWFR